MSDHDDVRGVLSIGADDAPAIGAPGRRAMSFGELRRHADGVVADLNALGLGAGDNVAIVLPDGPEMASAFVSIACAAATAPLNPAYREQEFDFYLGDLNARALVVLAGEDGPARTVAARRGVPVIELSPDESGPAGAFRLSGEARSFPLSGEAREGAARAVGAADVALVLHTSGTTSRPMMVPLLHRNVAASAGHIARTLRLEPGDRCLNIMPLFHIHGLMAAVLASLRAGASVWCCPGFNALRLFAWMAEVGPSWYTAVPTMHQAILARAERNPEVLKALDLRLIRSSSSSLPPQIMLALEETFGCPVIESYGMTEAAHQMASNPLPPQARRPGSVGVAAGPEVQVMDEAGAILATDRVGEVVIRGPNVTAGYLENPEANATAFHDGWFRTGDQGVLDGEGYLTITGRLKEIINRGGEKVSPREVDEVLLDHPDIDQAVTFAMPHDKLGEEVAVAIVARQGAEIDSGEVRAFARDRLADFKVPRRVVLVEEIPKGATGKLQRIGLAEKLGLAR